MVSSNGGGHSAWARPLTEEDLAKAYSSSQKTEWIDGLFAGIVACYDQVIKDLCPHLTVEWDFDAPHHYMYLTLKKRRAYLKGKKRVRVYPAGPNAFGGEIPLWVVNKIDATLKTFFKPTGPQLVLLMNKHAEVIEFISKTMWPKVETTQQMHGQSFSYMTYSTMPMRGAVSGLGATSSTSVSSPQVRPGGYVHYRP